MSHSSASASETQVFFYERWRSVSAGILETAGSTFLLLIAVKWFAAGATAKALIAGSGSVGLLLSPWALWTVRRLDWTPAHGAAWISMGGSAGYLLAALIPTLPVFIVGCAWSTLSLSALIPLLIQLYQDAYPKERRGRLFSRTVMIRIALAAIFAEAGGRFLSWRLEWFQGLLLVFGLSMLAGGWCLSRCPSTRLSAKQSPALFGAWRFVREDVQFRWTLYCWMLMGLANLMMLPLRVEYLANPKYGLALSATTIAVLTGVIPNAARLVMSSVWGYLFDRMNFFVLRIVLNLCFAVGIFSFFTGAGWGGLVGGALVFGVATAGGDVAWSLWVTKMTPPEHVAEYMSVHTFLTGVRGVVAPWLAFQAAQIYALTTLAWVCAGMIVVATVMLIPEIRAVRNRQGVPLVEEVAE